MKIAYFLDVDNGAGGAGILLIRLASIMARKNEVIVFIPCDSNKVPNKEYVDRCNRASLPYSCIHFSSSYNMLHIDYLLAQESIHTIRDCLVYYKVDIIHSTQLNIAVEEAARQLKIPHVMSTYSINPKEFLIDYGDLYAKYHLCDSELYSDIWKKNLHVISKCIRPVSQLDKIVEKKEKEDNIFRFLMLGNIHPWKNQLEAIKAIAMCRQYQIELFILGSEDPEYAKKCKEYVTENNLCDTVHFLGFKSDVTDMLILCDALICASTRESFPSSIVEAMSYDLSIISTPVAGIPEILKNKKNAFVSQGYDCYSIFQAIEEFLVAVNTKTICNIKSDMHNTWKLYMSPCVIYEQLYNYYDEIIKKKYCYESSFYELAKKVFEIEEKVKGSDNFTFFKPRCLYYTFLEKKLYGKKILIWGCGMLGNYTVELIHLLDANIQIEAMIDSNKSGYYYNYPIIKKEEIVKYKNYYILISFYNEHEKAIAYLEELGFSYNENFWLCI